MAFRFAGCTFLGGIGAHSGGFGASARKLLANGKRDRNGCLAAVHTSGAGVLRYRPGPRRQWSQRPVLAPLCEETARAYPRHELSRAAHNLSLARQKRRTQGRRGLGFSPAADGLLRHNRSRGAGSRRIVAPG